MALSGENVICKSMTYKKFTNGERPTPPVQRALKTTVKKLKARGHEVIDWTPDLHRDMIELLVGSPWNELDIPIELTVTQSKFFVADGGKTLVSILEPSQEPFRPELKMYQEAKEIGVSELWKLQAKRLQLTTEYLQRVESAGIDAVLSPTTPFASVEHTKINWVGYTGVFNIMDFSAVSFPTGMVADQEIDRLVDGEDILSHFDKATRDACECR